MVYCEYAMDDLRMDNVSVDDMGVVLLVSDLVCVWANRILEVHED